MSKLSPWRQKSSMNRWRKVSTDNFWSDYETKYYQNRLYMNMRRRESSESHRNINNCSFWDALIRKKKTQWKLVMESLFQLTIWPEEKEKMVHWGTRSSFVNNLLFSKKNNKTWIWMFLSFVSFFSMEFEILHLWNVYQSQHSLNRIIRHSVSTHTYLITNKWLVS